MAIGQPYAETDPVKTVAIDLAEDAWADLGQGPLRIASTSAFAVWVIGDDPPDLPPGVGYLAPPPKGPLEIKTCSHVWASLMAGSSAGTAIVSPYSP